MGKLLSFTMLIFATSANACPEYVGYLDELWPTYESIITGTILGYTDDGQTLRFTLFGYASGMHKGDVSTDFILSDAYVHSVKLDESECQFVIVAESNPAKKNGF